MAGIYIHIPFCRQACHYCDFHFSTNLSLIADVVNAICKEIAFRSETTSQIKTIYFGGGTPSLIDTKHIESILNAIHKNFSLDTSYELTLEANPEDASIQKLSELKEIGVNRLSIGAQVFSDDSLKWMNRAHNRDGVILAMENSRNVGFENISIDLMYAVPNTKIKDSIAEVVRLNPEHISLYGLTIEPQTVFGKWQETGDLKTVSEEFAADQYLECIQDLNSAAYIQYEVSNFAKNGFESKHNSSYWAGEIYYGFGPGAHSFNGRSRRINIRNNSKYCKGINQKSPVHETEILSFTQLQNEKILTSLRTKKGLDLNTIDFNSGKIEYIRSIVSDGLASITNNRLSLTAFGFLNADTITLELMFDE